MKRIIFILFLLVATSKLFAQSSIILPNGTVIPSFTQATRPVNPVKGQLIYQTDGSTGLYIWNGTAWTAVSSGGSGGGGTVTNVTANSPLSVTNGSTTPAITIQQANGTTNGFLSSTDWNTFNNKQNTLPNANTATSGILTSADWNTFNNKQNTLQNANATTSGILTSTDWNTFNNKQNPLSNANATTSGILTSADWNTFNSKQSPLPDANATTSGILTSADWSIFNNKQSPLSNANATTSGILTSADWNTFNNKQNPLPDANATTSGILTSADWNTFNNKQSRFYPTNGLKTQNDSIKLGGSLSESTFINLNTKDFSLGGYGSEQLVINNPMPNNNNYGSVESGFGQSFQASYSGILTKITLTLKVNSLQLPTIPINYTIYSGDGFGGAVLKTGNFNLPPTFTYYPVPTEIGNLNLPVTAGNMYTIKVDYGTYSCYVGVANGTAMPGVFYYLNGNPYTSWDAGILTYQINNTDVLRVKGGNQKVVLPYLAGSGTRPLVIAADGSLESGSNLAQASATSSGYLSSTDWNTFNNKLSTIPDANATTTGKLTSSDWNIFNSKQNALPSFTAGSVIFSSGSNLGESNSKLFWNNSNNRLGLGTNLPKSTLSISNTNTALSWIAADFGESTGSRLVMGTLNGRPTIGATIDQLTTWDTLSINNGGPVKLPYYASSTPKLLGINAAGALTLNSIFSNVKNGLSIQNDTLKLGGSLSQNTNILLNQKQLIIKASPSAQTLAAENPQGSSDTQVEPIGQSFKAINTGTLTKISVALGAPGPFPFSGSYQVFQGDGFGGTLLGSGNITFPLIGDLASPTYTDIVLSIPIVANQTYTIKLIPNILNYAIIYKTQGNLFTAGTLYNNAGVPVENQDVSFRTFEMADGSNVLNINGANNTVQMASLAGTGTRTVVAAADGTLSAVASQSTVTFVSGVAPIQVSNNGSTPQITITQASGTSNGYLSATDWNTFNNKYNLPSLTNGSILFSNGTTISQSNANLFWDNTNKALGIGTTSPNAGLHINGYGWDNGFRISSSGGVGPAVFLDGETDFAIVSTSSGAGAGANKFAVYDATANQYRMTINNSGAMGVGTSNPTTKLEINGLGGLKVSSNYNNSGYTDWVSGNFGGQSGDRLVVGVFNQTPTIGGHNSDLNEWRNLALNPISGNVGIGTDAPTAKLDVVGTVRLRTGATENAVLVSDANGNASWNSKTPLRTASVAITVPPTVTLGGTTTHGMAEVEWVHNLGYQPIIMITNEQANEYSLMEYVRTSYYHVDNNTLRIRCTNAAGGIAQGTFRILIVN